MSLGPGKLARFTGACYQRMGGDVLRALDREETLVRAEQGPQSSPLGQRSRKAVTSSSNYVSNFSAFVDPFLVCWRCVGRLQTIQFSL